MAISQKKLKAMNDAEDDLKREEAEENLNRIKSNLETLKNKSNGTYNNIWKLKKKFFPKVRSAIPVAKKNLNNQVITNPSHLKKVYVKHFQHRMRKRPSVIEYKDYQDKIEDKFSSILNVTKQNK